MAIVGKPTIVPFGLGNKHACWILAKKPINYVGVSKGLPLDHHMSHYPLIHVIRCGQNHVSLHECALYTF